MERGLGDRGSRFGKAMARAIAILNVSHVAGTLWSIDMTSPPLGIPRSRVPAKLSNVCQMGQLVGMQNVSCRALAPLHFVIDLQSLPGALTKCRKMEY